MVNAKEIKRIPCILDDGKSQYEIYDEEDTKHYIEKVKELLQENGNKNMIYCIRKYKYKKYRGRKYKLYMLVNLEFDSREELDDAVMDYRSKGYKSFYIYG
jgi:uncharacterized protein (DUF1330 family)